MSDPPTGHAGRPTCGRAILARLRSLLTVQSLTLIMVIGGGAALSVLAAVSVKRANEAQLERSFHEMADARGEAIQGRLERNVEVLHTIAKLFQASVHVDRREFRTFVAGWLEGQNGIAAFEWIPRIDRAHVDDFLAETRAAGFPEVKRLEAETSATHPEVVWPVAFAEPHDHAREVVGSDLASAPWCREAMTRAGDTGRAATARPPSQPAATGAAASDVDRLRVLWPVYRNGAPPATQEDRRQALIGFLSAVVDLEAACSEALSGVALTRDTLDVFVVDLEQQGPGRLIHTLLTTQRVPGDRLAFDEDDLRAGLHNRRLINLGGRPIEVLCAPTRSFYTMHATWLAWGILAAGMGCSGLLAACISLVDRRARAADLINRDLRREISERRHVQAQLVRAKHATDSANQQLKQEIAERIQAEEDRRESESRLHELADNIRAVLWLADAETGRILYVSSAYESVWARRCRDLYEDSNDRVAAVHPGDRRRVALAWARPVKRAFRQEYRIIRPDGTERWIEDRWVPILDDSGELRRVVGIAEDISERKIAEEELRLAHEELQTSQAQLFQAAKLESVGRLAAGVAHEVKNPLATMLLGLDFLTDGNARDAEQQERVVANMKESIHRADTVIRGLLDFAAPREIDLQPEDIHDVIGRSLMLVSGDLLHSHVSVGRRFSEELPHVRLDSQKIQQVFVNLFVNACQAMEKGGDITISTRLEEAEPWCTGGALGAPYHRGPSVVVDVEDTGSGIPDDKLEKIFDPFFTTKPVGVGTGLGLSVSKKIMELHQATIQFRNRPEGGVCATLSFPARQGQDVTWKRSESSSLTTK